MTKPSIQRHHISYDPEIVVKIYRGEHRILTLLNRATRHVSSGFIKCLREWIDNVKDIVVDLDEE